MPRLPDEELAAGLHLRRGQAVYVPLEPYAGGKLNDCHENARKYADEHPGCRPIQGWLIEQFVGWNYFLAHTIIERPDGLWIDPTPMRGQYGFLRHDGSVEDFEEQRQNRPQIQFASEDMGLEEIQLLLSTADSGESSEFVEIDGEYV